MKKYQGSSEGIKELRRIYTEAYENDPVVRAGFDAMSEILVMPIAKALRDNDSVALEQAKHNLEIMFHMIGRTYNPEYPKK